MGQSLRVKYAPQGNVPVMCSLFRLCFQASPGEGVCFLKSRDFVCIGIAEMRLKYVNFPAQKKWLKTHSDLLLIVLYVHQLGNELLHVSKVGSLELTVIFVSLGF